ncbi:hypothetical protein [Pleionea sediminis]|uniref:hypothetical protein n=1 Tax=Pleionea sediminis TaxID=2569479 RepID=UPI0011864C9D|nr:hypothetical protein [Pleionea sediminis]
MKYLNFGVIGLNIALATLSFMVVYRTGSYTYLFFGLVCIFSLYKIILNEYSLILRVANLGLILSGAGLGIASLTDFEIIYLALALLIVGILNIVLFAKFKKESELSDNPFII